MPPAPPKKKTAASAPSRNKSKPTAPKPKQRAANNAAAAASSSATAAAPKPRKRKAAEVEPSDDETEPTTTPTTTAPLLTARTRSIPHLIFNERWGRLPAPALSSLHALITTAQRPAITSFRKDPQRAAAQRVITRLSAKLTSSLAKCPVPPLAKEYASLELERMLEKAREADAVLQPTRRQVGELERELEREERARRRDEGLLRDLVRNARGQEEVRREKRKTLPRCLKEEPEGRNEIADTLVVEEKGEAGRYKLQNDREMLPVTEQLQQHLRSMEANAGLVAGVPEWMAAAREAVGEVLKEAEDPTVYDKVMSVF